jgi:invasion protein IalB
MLQGQVTAMAPVRRVSMCLGLLAVSGGQVPASEGFRDWTVSCAEAPAACVLSTTAIAQDDTWLATLRLQLAAGQPAAGAAAGAGAALGASGLGAVSRPRPAGAAAAGLSALRPDHCEAAAALDADRLDAMMAGRAAVLTYRPSISSPPVSFEVSLMGITAAIGHARAQLP